MLISPSEPPRLKELGKVSSIPEQHGSDFIILSERGRLGVQRKKFPEDLLSSLSDGRLYEQLPQMKTLERGLVIIEGYGKWTAEGELFGMRRFTYAQLIGLFATIMFEFGFPVIWLRDIKHTIKALVALEAWCGKKKHTSLLRRAGPKSDAWGRISSEAWAAHLVQSFPGMGPVMATTFNEYFDGPPLQWTVTKEQMMEVPGIGKGRAEALIEALQREEETDGSNSGQAVR